MVEASARNENAKTDTQSGAAGSPCQLRDRCQYRGFDAPAEDTEQPSKQQEIGQAGKN